MLSRLALCQLQLVLCEMPDQLRDMSHLLACMAVIAMMEYAASPVTTSLLPRQHVRAVCFVSRAVLQSHSHGLLPRARVEASPESADSVES